MSSTSILPAQELIENSALDDSVKAFLEKIEYAKKVGRNMKLPVLNPYERKKVHSYIADKNDTEIKTESKWEWKERRLFIILSDNLRKNPNNDNIPSFNSIKPTKLEIDIDWDDI